MHRPVGLPANSKNPVARPASRKDGGRHRMGNLWAGIAAEVANTRRAGIHPPRQRGRRHRLTSACRLSKVPILTPQTIEGAGLVENREVCKPVFWSGPMRPLGIPDTRPRRADPIRHAVRRQGIVVPTQVSLGRRASRQATTHVSAEPAVAKLTGGNPTLVGAEVTQDTARITRRFGRKAKGTAGPLLHPGKVQRDVRRGSSKTGSANAQARRGQR